MKPQVPALLVVCLLAGASASAQAPLFTNAQLVSIDTRGRQIVVRDNDGHTRTLPLDAEVSVAGLRLGDEVILTVRDASRAPHVSRIMRSVASSERRLAAADQNRTTAAATTSATSVASPSAPAAQRAAGDAFAGRVSALAQQATYVDVLWDNFVNACDVTASAGYDRAWFALWQDGAVRFDRSTAVCREMYNQLVARGESVKAGMAAAEESARQASLLPGAVRDVRQRYDMDWDGWDRPAPRREAP